MFILSIRIILDMNKRKQQARQILETPSTIAQVDTGKIQSKIHERT